MITIPDMIQFIQDNAKIFGASEGDYILRNNTKSDAFSDHGAYFGFIHPEESNMGPYHDFSFTIFPSNNNEQSWLVCLGIGSNGFKNDYELATFPGLKRLFRGLIDQYGFCKPDFSDIQTKLPKSILNNDKLGHIKKTIEKYSQVLPVCQIIDPTNDESAKITITAFLAAYAKLREWPSNKDHREALSKALKKIEMGGNLEDDIKQLLLERKFVVLQGPPGTGKTRIAKKVAKNIHAETYFTQFHAETSYSDFIYGIRPSLSSGNLGYEEKIGVFPEAIRNALLKPDVNVVLIIDELNRANLSNVLGPIFYLFEHKMDSSEVEIEVYPDLRVKKLPDNFYVIATMNSADRSLAVVDFALRRRFAWYTIKPHLISDSAEKFFNEDFNKFKEIFEWYASDSELNLQPGQGYFLASSRDEMNNRIHYELYPLIKEYLQEGLLKSAQNEFEKYFSDSIKLSLFE